MCYRIKDLREDNDLSQAKIAKVLHMSQSGYAKYEKGEINIPTKVLIQLADFYNTSVDYILERTNIAAVPNALEELKEEK